jgi:hypothetical protein
MITIGQLAGCGIRLVPSDPHLYELADRSQRWMANRQDSLAGRQVPVLNPAIAELVVTSVEASSPTWDRLNEIAKQRKAAQF